MQLTRLAVLTLATTAFIAACGGSTPGPTQPGSIAPAATGAGPGATTGPSEPAGATSPPVAGPVDACSLLTPADLTAALGDEYAPGTLDSVGQCLWNLPGMTANTGSLVVGAITESDLATIKSLFGDGGTDVTVGSHAAFYNPKEGLNSLWVDLGGGRLFVLSFPRSGDLDPSFQAIALQLAEIAVGNM